MRIRIITAVSTTEKRVCTYTKVSTDSRRQEESLDIMKTGCSFRRCWRSKSRRDQSDYNKVHIMVCTKYRHRSESCERTGCQYFFEEQNVNTLSGDGEVMFAVLVPFVQEESNSKSKNNKER